MTEAPVPIEVQISNVKHKHPTKHSITKRLLTDLRWSMGVTAATQLVRLIGLPAQPPHSLQQPGN